MEGRYSRRKRVNTSFEYADCAQGEKRLKQPSYEPVQSESMSKEELSAWRKAQRRLRNRQVRFVLFLFRLLASSARLNSTNLISNTPSTPHSPPPPPE